MSKELIILAVDDDLINLKLLKSMLMKNPDVKEVLEAKNGADAVSQIKSRSDINLILLDIIMPIMNGLEVLKVVRSDENIEQLPIIVLTTDETKKTEALELGANDFLMKPIRSVELMQKIEAIII
ncbi:MAG: response regulator receiver protein [Sulfurimonas sp. RIFCSPHIGHO2_12_FULL_36_9]|jgi:putative two-component system response regulator|uniref:response regulator n=1 Tax=Sulfurimonas sp. RIFCSPLOWO2_12_36_12 TaxID=1802253 RepID=UPI0008CA53AC|nr:response regulator [Sulfurimonas sp. RIFCSPLOWO2_12_36_12]OHD97505.1 MAG: response regulator receiver protein [Sulfurimonas sp. RIFCSPHIGHO2_12_FULL_36_9]OHD99752.1 MAG: response regulator receiver protein [Sulfurimonas sp. RIFCSPLOWO2_02_FULL_36_28]OHE02961.1 MAG: response regulator receiver protein [Sulfurimonas sp. RIFCSPLOWO2_12_36_12]OHE05149.1 MAG: response regulator receiver protein [Sulfurimonas sp. RIFCSPLOWO2_12_FULL_36_74]